MIKFISVILIISMSYAIAEPSYELGSCHADFNGPSSIDDLAYSQTYDYAELVNGYSNYGAGDRWICDDFELTESHYINTIVVWMIWTGSMGSDMYLVFSEDVGDSDPNNATDVWAETAPCTNVFTGDQNWGYDIYETTIDIDVADVLPELTGGVHYWLETQADVTDNCFQLVGNHYILSYVWYNDGSGVWVRSDVAFNEATDTFMDFYSDS